MLAAYLTLVYFLQKLDTEELPVRPWTTSERELRAIGRRQSSSPQNPSSSTSLSTSTTQFRYLHSRFYSRKVKPPGSAYSRIVVIPRMQEDNVSWISEELPDIPTAIYTANNPKAPLHPPRNKGHEVMIYLTYIIDHYDSLPDIMIFMHAHRYTHHNADLLGFDAVQMIRRLSSDHVVRQGYVNMRCQWNPGCPEWLHPENATESLERQEEVVLEASWLELFPSEPLPRALGQPCCAQFAVSRERVRTIPLSSFVFYRDWVLRTPLSDYVSGRIWEYLWQFLFTGQSILCPAEYVCWCDAFGLCFGGAGEYAELQRLRNSSNGFRDELKMLQQQGSEILPEGTAFASGSKSSMTDPGRHSYLNSKIAALDMEVFARRKAALERGLSPEARAQECGRSWEQDE